MNLVIDSGRLLSCVSSHCFRLLRATIDQIGHRQKYQKYWHNYDSQLLGHMEKQEMEMKMETETKMEMEMKMEMEQKWKTEM